MASEMTVAIAAAISARFDGPDRTRFPRLSHFWAASFFSTSTYSLLAAPFLGTDGGIARRSSDPLQRSRQRQSGARSSSENHITRCNQIGGVERELHPHGQADDHQPTMNMMNTAGPFAESAKS